MKSQANTRRIAIIVLTLATALIHLIVLNIRMMSAFGRIDVMFTLNGLGFLGLLVAYLAPSGIPLRDLLLKYHNLLRWVFIGYTALTILAWAVITGFNLTDPLALVTKAIEILLIIFLATDR